jgi:hypothetical protein
MPQITFPTHLAQHEFGKETAIFKQRSLKLPTIRIVAELFSLGSTARILTHRGPQGW